VSGTSCPSHVPVIGLISSSTFSSKLPFRGEDYQVPKDYPISSQSLHCQSSISSPSSPDQYHAICFSRNMEYLQQGCTQNVSIWKISSFQNLCTKTIRLLNIQQRISANSSNHNQTKRSNEFRQVTINRCNRRGTRLS
jgi:hypothetical protein